MQQIQEMLILSALLINLAKAITDLDCTVIDSDPISFTFGFPIFAQSGFGCVDKLGSSSCLTFFGSPPLVNTDSPDRPTACFTDTGNPNGPVVPKIKQFAIENCQATCAYCCIQAPPKCSDKGQNIDCSKVTQAMCTDPIWQNFMAEECPATCSLCDFVDCSADISICTNRNWEAFVKHLHDHNYYYTNNNNNTNNNNDDDNDNNRTNHDHDHNRTHNYHKSDDSFDNDINDHQHHDPYNNYNSSNNDNNLDWRAANDCHHPTTSTNNHNDSTTATDNDNDDKSEDYCSNCSSNSNSTRSSHPMPKRSR